MRAVLVTFGRKPAYFQRHNVTLLRQSETLGTPHSSCASLHAVWRHAGPPIRGKAPFPPAAAAAACLPAACCLPGEGKSEHGFSLHWALCGVSTFYRKQWLVCLCKAKQFRFRQKDYVSMLQCYFFLILLPLWRFTSELSRKWFQVMSCHGLCCKAVIPPWSLRKIFSTSCMRFFRGCLYPILC